MNDNYVTLTVVVRTDGTDESTEAADTMLAGHPDVMFVGTQEGVTRTALELGADPSSWPAEEPDAEQHAADLSQMWERAKMDRLNMVIMATLPDGTSVGGFVIGHGSLYSVQDPERGMVEDIRPEWIHWAMLTGPIVPN